MNILKSLLASEGLTINESFKINEYWNDAGQEVHHMGIYVNEMDAIGEAHVSAWIVYDSEGRVYDVDYSFNG